MASDSPWSNPNLRPPHPPALGLPQAVTQDELRRLQALLRHQREAERLQKSILERLEAGAEIECGRMTARVQQSNCRRITQSALEQFWGTEYVESLRQQIPKTVQLDLEIEDQFCSVDL